MNLSKKVILIFLVAIMVIMTTILYLSQNVLLKSYEDLEAKNAQIHGKTIERYGGSVAVEDNKPQGTVFVLKIPQA